MLGEAQHTKLIFLLETYVGATTKPFRGLPRKGVLEPWLLAEPGDSMVWLRQTMGKLPAKLGASLRDGEKPEGLPAGSRKALRQW